MLLRECGKGEFPHGALCFDGIHLLPQALGEKLDDFKEVVAADGIRKDGIAEQVHILIAGHIGRFFVLGVIANQERFAAETEPVRDPVVARHVLIEVLRGNEYGAAVLALDADVGGVVAVTVGNARNIVADVRQQLFCHPVIHCLSNPFVIICSGVCVSPSSRAFQ